MTISLSRTGVEKLDDPATPAPLVQAMLRDIAVSNRWFGGWSAARRGLNRLVDSTDRRLTLLDIGTGAGDLPLRAKAWADQRGITLDIIGIERLPAAASLAGAAMPVALACAGALPIRSDGVDIVLVSQVAHHLDDSSAIALFAACNRIARRGVIVADLMPSRSAGVAFRAAGSVLSFQPHTIEDAVVSLARGFSRKRLHRLVGDAGITTARIETLPFARIVATWRTG